MHAVSIGNEWEKNILEGSSGQEQDLPSREGIAERCEWGNSVNYPWEGERLPPHPAAGISGQDWGRWAVPELPGQQGSTSLQVSRGSDQDHGQKRVTLWQVRSTCQAVLDQETLGHCQGDLASWMSLPSLEMEAKHDDGNKTSAGSQSH